MDNSRTLIRSSIVSLILVSFGLFLLCMGESPKIDAGNSALQDGEEADLLSLLDEAGDEINLGEGDDLFGAEDNSSTGGDDALAALLDQGDETINTDEPAESTKDNRDELQNLLKNDNETKYTEDSQDYASGTEDDMDQLLNMLENDSDTEYANETELEQGSNQPTELVLSDVSEQGSETSSQSATLIQNLKDDIGVLEEQLAERTTEKENLETELQNYDLQIAKLENRSSSGGFDHSIQQTAYSESQPFNSPEIDRQSMNSFAADNFELVYQDALQSFHEHRYNSAINQFYKLLQTNQRHSLADNCQYWIGECYYAQVRYYQAIAEFTKVAAFDAADKKDDAQMMLGLAFMKLGETQHAQAELDWLLSSYASSEYV